ncbi:type I secretion system permease/ATPase [Rickettsiales bacterium]|nr:type I secretion system permease/ATPase [Rickettsiales bacterium]
MQDIKFDLFNRSLKACKIVFYYSLLFSFISNLMMLAVPIYSLQVLDRVISSGSLETLLMLTLVVMLALVALSLIQIVRSEILIRLGNWLDRKLSPLLFEHGISESVTKKNIAGSQHLQDLASIKGFLTGAGINALLDAPWSLIFIIVLFFIHPSVGIISILGGAVLLTLAVINELKTKPLLNEASEYSMKSSQYADLASRNAEVIEAMGMMENVSKIWRKVADKGLSLQSAASGRSAIFSGITRFLRMSIQIAVTGMGAYFTLKAEMTVGSMIASGILVGRALAPFENAIASWKSFVQARKSFSRLSKSLERAVERPDTIELPEPAGNINVENIYFAPAGVQKPTIKGMSFSLDAGDVLAIIGPSAAGKSTLAKLLTGVWKTASGNVRLDGADVYSWNRNHFAKHVGYLPQDVELFSGTVKDNIARMDVDANDQDIINAAINAQVHDLILRLPNGYETEIGVGGSYLSAGQRQRIALARAFYGNPKFIVLDEPNANLDSAGDVALAKSIAVAKENGSTLIIISHRPSILQIVDKILVMQDGTVAKFGSRDDILGDLKGNNQGKLKAV